MKESRETESPVKTSKAHKTSRPFDDAGGVDSSRKKDHKRKRKDSDGDLSRKQKKLAKERKAVDIPSRTEAAPSTSDGVEEDEFNEEINGGEIVDEDGLSISQKRKAAKLEKLKTRNPAADFVLQCNVRHHR